MQKRNIIEQLFETRDMAGEFNFRNKNLKEVEKENDKIEQQITRFLNTRVHPKSKKILRNLLNNLKKYNIRYYDKERGLVYESGFIDGINLMLLVMNKK